LYIRKVLFVIKLALVLLLCFVIVKTVIIPQHPARIFTPASAVGTENKSANGAENPVEALVEDYSDIVERNIFGGAVPSDVEDKSSRLNKFDCVAKSAEEELSLALVGTVCGSAEVSRAIIKNTKTKLLKMYKTGQNVADLENIPMAKALGLKNGDIIRVVNGHRLTSKQKALQVFKKARSQETMSVELLRDGETKELSFDLQ